VSLLRLPLKTGDYSFDVGHGGGHFRSSAEHARIWFESSRVSMMITSHGDGVAIGFTSHEPA